MRTKENKYEQMIQKIENCIYCGNKMDDVRSAKRKFCNDKCRIYFGRELKRGTLDIPIRATEIEAKIENRKHELTSAPNDVAISNKQQSPQKSERIVLDDNNNEVVDYQKLFNECEFDEERKLLWERIKIDVVLNEREKKTWKLRLGIR